MDRGRDRQGLDCYGLVRLIYQEQRQIELPPLTEAYTHIAGEEPNISAVVLAQVAQEAMTWGPVTEPDPFDVVVFRIGGFPIHVAVCVKPQTMIHSLKGCEVAIERYTSPLWARRVDGFYRYTNHAQPDHRLSTSLQV